MLALATQLVEKLEVRSSIPPSEIYSNVYFSVVLVFKPRTWHKRQVFSILKLHAPQSKFCSWFSVFGFETVSLAPSGLNTLDSGEGDLGSSEIMGLFGASDGSQDYMLSRHS